MATTNSDGVYCALAEFGSGLAILHEHKQDRVTATIDKPPVTRTIVCGSSKNVFFVVVSH